MTDRTDRVDRIQAEWRRERPDLDVSAQAVIGRLHRLALALTDRIVTVYDEYGLSEGDFDVLCALRRAGEPFERQPVDLAHTTMVTTGGLTKRVDRLESAGLVERTRPQKGDGRTKVVRLTDQGRTLIDAAFTDHAANEAKLVGLLSASDQAHLARILRIWSERLDSD